MAIGSSRSKKAGKMCAVLRSAMSEPLEERRLLASTLISFPNTTNVVYDDVRDILYASTTGGLLQRYDVASGTILSPITLGGYLTGFDITPDGKTAYVANGSTSNNQGTLFKVNLIDGSKTTLTFPLVAYENEPFGVAIANNGKGLITTAIGGGVRQIDLATDTITGRADYTASPSQYIFASRSEDRSLIMLQDSDSSTGQIGLYRAATDNFLKYNIGDNTPQTYIAVGDAVFSRDDSLIALRRKTVGIMDQSLATVRTISSFNSFDASMAFDPVRDVLYGVNVNAADISAPDQVIAYDTNTWKEKYRLPLGSNESGAGTPVINAE